MATEKSAPGKRRWGELGEEDGEDLDFLLPPKQVIGPDEPARLSNRAVERRNWPKFGDAVHEDVGTRLTTVSTEEILLERPRAPGYKADESKMVGDGLAQLTKGGAVLMLCRTCGKKGDHWTSRCPYKDLAPLTGNLVDTPSMSSGAKRYVVGPDFKRTNEEAVRVTNLSKDTQEPDLLELFRSFGPASRAFVPINQKTGMSCGFGFVTFENKEDAERATNNLNGYCYNSLILRVERTTPRAT